MLLSPHITCVVISTSISLSDDSSTSPAGETTNTDSQQQLLQQTDLGPAIGGAVGGVIAVSLITVLVIIIVILAVKRGQMGSLKVRDNAGSAPGYNNALYATGEGMIFAHHMIAFTPIIFSI